MGERRADVRPRVLVGDAAALFNPKRFAIASLLYLRGPMAMSSLRELTGLSWGDLDSNLRFLREKGLVASRKVLTRGGPRTIVALTERGVKAYEDLVEYLLDLLPLGSEGSSPEAEG